MSHKLFLLVPVLLLLNLGDACRAQNAIPSVTDLIQKNDANGDGVLTLDEVKGARYERQFSHWDQDKSDDVSKSEIIRFRARFGIGEDGTKVGARRKTELKIPAVDAIARVDRANPPGREKARTSEYILRTSTHAVDGTRYVILTDHSNEAFLKPLELLAKHHDGLILRVDDLSSLNSQSDEFLKLRLELEKVRPKYVAIAPKVDSCSENTVLALWELLTTIDADPQLDVLPGFLLASNEKAFAKLIEQSIAWKPKSKSELRPLAISQVPSARETRSLQKAGILKNMFADQKIEMPVLAIYRQQAMTAPKLKGKNVWNVTRTGKQFSGSDLIDPTAAIKQASLVVMHGHGVPGMSCSVDIDNLPKDLDGKIFLTGSCFSASPAKSDLPAMRKAPGGYDVQKRDAFTLRAIDSGAVVAFGHQRLSLGFPHLFPMLESMMGGKTLGLGYQELLNGLIDYRQAKSGDFVLDAQALKKTRVPQNAFLYILIGDPALQPFKAFGDASPEAN